MKPVFACLALVFSSSVIASDEWPQFRGPDGQGRSASSGLPIEWSESENVTWKTTIPGEGHSSPVISGDQIWLTTAVAAELSEEEETARLSSIKNPRGLKLAGRLSLKALLFSRSSGELKKQVTLFEVSEPEPKHSLNSYASPTPVISGGFIFFHFGTYGTACVERRTGEIVWKNDSLHVDHQNGPGSSPILWDNLLIAHFDGIDEQFLAAFDCKSGDVRWQTTRSGEMDPKVEFRKAYGTPLIVESDGRSILVSPAANWVYGYDPATGEEIWKAHYGKLGFSTVPRPVAEDGIIYMSTSYMQPRLLAVDVGGRGDVTESHVKWTSDRQAPKKPSMLVVQGHLYTVTDNGIAACLSCADGAEIWKARLDGDFSASPLYAGGLIYFFGQDGKTTVVREGEAFEQVAKNQLDGSFMASPAVADDSLYLRTESALYCLCSDGQTQ